VSADGQLIVQPSFKKFFPLLAGAALFAGVFSARATSPLPFYEPFPSTYTEGERLGGATTVGVWSYGNSTGADSVSNTVNAALNYSGLLTTAGSRGAFFTSNSPSSGRVRGAGFTPQTPSASNQTFYAAFLFSLVSAPTGNRCVVSLDSSVASTPNASVGCWVNISNQLLIGKTSMTAPAAAVTTPLTANTTHLVVLKYKWTSAAAGDDVVSLFLDPIPGDNEPAAPTLSTASGSDAGVLQSFYCIQGSASGVYKTGSFLVDEIRVSTNWADVTPSTVCNPALITTNPVDQTTSVGSTASFNVTASGSIPTYQWQLSTDNGASWNNILTGGNAANYTTPVLGAGDNGSKFRCVANVTCGGGSTATSGVATLTVADPSGKWFRSVASGNWNSPATWEQSLDGGAWIPATVAPSSLSSNIVVRASHTVSVTTAVTADELTIETNAELDANGATFTLADGAAAIDCTVSGTLRVTSTAGSALVTGTAGLQFNSGGKFQWSGNTAPVIPTATWSDGSLCLIENSAAANVNCTGVSGQSFYDFTVNFPALGFRTRLAVTDTNTVIRRNFSITIPDVANASVMLLTNNGALLTVGGDCTFVTGGSSVTTKVLTRAASGENSTLKVGGNFSVTGYLDAFSTTNTGGSTIEFAGTNSHTLTLDPAHQITGNVNHISYQADNSTALTLASAVPGCANFSVGTNATLNCSTNKITGGAASAFTLNPGAIIFGNGTNQLTAGFGTINFGGTVNLGALPAFVGGETFLLFGGTTFSGALALVPTAPSVSQTWDTSALNTTGTLGVSGAAGPSAGHIDSVTVSSGNVVLTISGGAANTAFSVTATSNLTVPRTNWPTVGSGTFNGGGAATVTNPASGNLQFHSLRVP
jgi:hypothetical protein